MIVVIQALVILFTGAMEDMFRPGAAAHLRDRSARQTAEAVARNSASGELSMDLVIIALDCSTATIRLSTPLLLACLAGLYSERAGVFDIGLEGKMLAARLRGAAAVAAVTGSVWLGPRSPAIAVSVGFALVQGVASITLKGNQIISGVAINMLAAGLTIFLGQPGSSRAAARRARRRRRASSHHAALRRRARAACRSSARSIPS